MSLEDDFCTECNRHIDCCICKTCTQCGVTFQGEDKLCPHCAEVWDKINLPHEKDSDPGRPVRPHRSGGGHWVGH